MRAAALAVVALVGGCPDRSPRATFDERVAPILERRCLSAACHGVAAGAEASGEVIDRRFFFVDVDARGRIADRDAAYADVKARIDTLERPEWSTLLRKPLAIAEGGVPHAGGHPMTRDDPDWIEVREWIASEQGGGEGTPRDQLDDLERRFADDVLPVLRDRGCMLARCHGSQMFGGLPLIAPMDGSGGDWSVAEIRANREIARANLALVGDPARSRLLRKVLPLDAGGIPHRGGNDLFFPRVGERAPLDDPAAQAILAWAEAERAALGFAAPAVQGVVFVRGPATPRALLDLDTARPGSDVWFYPSLAPGATPVNLTAGAHAGPADVRDPAVSHDGARVAFAMRRAGDACHQVWEIRLDGTGLRQRTDAGCNRWPVWGPGDDLYLVSTRAGHADESGRRDDTELYRIADDGAATRLTFSPTPEATPTFLATGEFRGSLAFTTMRGDHGAVFRFPPDHDRAHHLQPEYHPHHGQTAPMPVVWAMRELADGRDVATLLSADSAWEGGALGVVERQFGPELPVGGEDVASTPGFRHAWTVLTAPTELWRDPAPLPDAGLIAARALDPAAPDTAIVRTEIVDGPGGATLAAPVVLWDSPGEADDQPAIVVARPDEDDPHADTWDGGATGLLRHTGVAVVEALNRGLPPRGARTLRDDVAAIRILAWPSWRAGAYPVDPARIGNGDPAATWWSDGVHLPVGVLDEVPVPADGTLWAEVPARTPLKLQLLDADGFAIGAPSPLWIHVQGDERFPQGAQPGGYARVCAGCHGALDGDPEHALGPLAPDAVTTASITLATYQDRNPRRPLPPVPVGAGGAADFDFGRDLGPVLARSCAIAGCHSDAAPAGGLDLTPTPTVYYDAAYEALQAFGDGSTGGKRYVDERGASARGSYLIEKVMGRELDAPRALGSRCPPPGAAVPPLSSDEIAALIRWIDLGAVYRSPAVEVP